MIEILADDLNVIVKAEDGACQEETLGNVDEHAVGYILAGDGLDERQRDTAHNEQHRAGVLRGFVSVAGHGQLVYEVLRQRVDHGRACDVP